MFNEVESDFGALVRDVFVLRYGFANIDQYLLSHIPWLRLRSYRQSSAETSRAQKKNKGHWKTWILATRLFFNMWACCQ